MLKNNFTRKSLANKIYKNLGFSKNISSTIIDDFFESLSNHLSENNNRKDKYS